MRETARKAAALAISAILAAGALVSCGSKSAGGTVPDPESSRTLKTTGREAADPGKPYKGVKLAWWTELSADVSATYPNLNNTSWTEYIQEKTGIELEFIHPTVGSEIEELSILVASSEYPDTIEYTQTIYSDSPQAAISDGVILNLTDVMVENAPSLTKLMQEHPDVDKMVRSANGGYCCFPFLRGLESPNSTQFSAGMVPHKDILDELGSEVPETIDKQDTTLRAYKGYGFEIPFATRKEWMKDVWSPGFDSWGDFYIEDGVVKNGLIEDSRKAFVTEMRDQYGEGLIDRDWLVADKSSNQTYFTTRKTASIYAPFGRGLEQYTQIMHGADPEITEGGIRLAVPVTSTKGQDAKFSKMNNIYDESGVSTAISTQCEDATAVAWLLDWIYSEERDLCCNFGIESETYKMRDGKPVYTDLIINNPEGLSVTNALVVYTRASSSGVCVQDEAYIEQCYELDNQKEALELSMETDMGERFFPPIGVAKKSSEQHADVMNNVKMPAKEMGTQFIAGTVSMDEWDKYQQQLKGFSIGDATITMQIVYDAYMVD